MDADVAGEGGLMTRTRERRGRRRSFERASVGVRGRYRRREDVHVIVSHCIFCD